MTIEEAAGKSPRLHCEGESDLRSQISESHDSCAPTPPIF